MILRRNKSKVWKECYKPVQGKLNEMLDTLDDMGYVIGDMNDEVMCENDSALNFHYSRNEDGTILKSIDSRIFYSLKEYERVMCEEFAHNNLHYFANLNIFWELENATKNNDAVKFLKVMTDKRDLLLSGKRYMTSMVATTLDESEMIERFEHECLNLNALEHLIDQFEIMINEVYEEVSGLINDLHMYTKVADEHVIEIGEPVNV